MAPLFNLKSLISAYSIFSHRLASKTDRFVFGDPMPSHFSLQNLTLCRHLTSEIPETQQNFAVNYLINSCGLSRKDAIIASKRLKLRSPERADRVLDFLRSHGLSQTQISKVVRSLTEVLHANPDRTFSPKIEYFRSIGVSREELARTLAYNPRLLTCSLEKRIVPTYDFLRSMMSEKNVASVLKSGSWIFVEGHSRNVAQNIGILREHGMPESCISLLLAHNTSALTRKTEKFAQVMDEVKKMGFDLGKSTSVMAIGALCSNNSKSRWKRKSDVYKGWGWSEDDVLLAFRKFPVCMAVSEKKVMQVMEFLVKQMGCPPEMIAKQSLVVSYSFEKRIIPRCSVVKVLSIKGLINYENMSLGYVLRLVEKLFLERFVAKYIDEVPQLLSVYQGKIGVNDAALDVAR